ncbi:phenylalanyl-tRNA synthetase alpha chain [Plasmodium gonderi]|uniref:Phenylalanyl-tRNA synthetase alpha chain n=1 Tax=Plasmodium gonderi TaxID=77519 RepID=A0A1Y1JM75_PLAGO|nr:phenylalanyl-tRNA synthetase alpha chain [Plasmodium gonderi]GAW83696.1 phenylalanyl-tRNA synthetase alpha chain [Plasmodium gonderi]
MCLFVILHTLFITIFFTQHSNCYNANKYPRDCVSKLVLSKLNNNYYVKDDIINYARFKYVYNIKNHPIHHVTREILKYLQSKSSFHVVYNKCPLYQRNICFNDILIKNTNDTTSYKNNFYFSDSLLYIPQATSLFPYIYSLIRDEQKTGKCDSYCSKRCGSINYQLRYAPNGSQETGEKTNDDIHTNEIIRKKECNRTEEVKGEKGSNICLYNKYYQNADREKSAKEEESSSIQQHMERNIENFLIISNIFRKDNIDKLHFPFFNQMDIYIKIKNELIEKQKQLLYFLCSLLEALFGKTHKWRIKKDSFDFTKYSLQAEVYYNDKWVEILGCGILKKKIFFQKNKQYDMCDYLALGLGIDRIAMIKWGINRIRDLYLYITNASKNVSSNKKKTHTYVDKQMNSNMIKSSSSSRSSSIPGQRTHGISHVDTHDLSMWGKSTCDDAERNESVLCEENILLYSPKLEGIHFRNELLKCLTRKRVVNRQKGDSFLYFLNLYNIRDEERDLSFYANSEWNKELFIKNVFNFAHIMNGHFLKRVILLDVFLHKGSGNTSYTYKFVYSPSAQIREQHIFKKLVKDLHEQIVLKIVSTYAITIR